MAPSITSISLLESPVLHKPEVIHNVYLKQSQKVDPYDATRPQNEYKFMHKVRQWEKKAGFVTALRWNNIIAISILHILGVVWLFYMLLTADYCKFKTFVFSFVSGHFMGFGVTAGAHRYWSHRSFKAKWPLQVFLAVCFTMAGQNTIYEWVRDHRVHHKFSETSGDPHDVNRGFFFSHVGWLMMKKHPDVLKEGVKTNMADIENDPIVQFQVKYFIPLKVFLCVVIPILVPVLCWDESMFHAVFSQIMLLVACLNCTWSVNSFAHIWGNKPYDETIKPVENRYVAIFAMGEGWHNYHHSFPWDYKASELSYTLNLTTLILDGFAKIGWAYDMKTASPSLVKAVARNKGAHKHLVTNWVPT